MTKYMSCSECSEVDPTPWVSEVGLTDWACAHRETTGHDTWWLTSNPVKRWEIARNLILETTNTQVLVSVRFPGGDGYTVPLTKLQAQMLRSVLTGWLATREVPQRGPGQASNG